MNAVRIRRKLDSETLHLPELRPLLGKTVEIIVFDESTPAILSGTGDLDAALNDIEKLEDYDFDALREQDECDREHAKDQLL